MMAHSRKYASLSGLVAGVAVLLGAFAILGLAGGATSWLLLDAAPTAERVRSAMLFGAAALVLACAFTGWVSARVAGTTTLHQSLVHGLLTATIGLVVLGLLVWVALHQTADFSSVGTTLGWIEIPDDVFRRPDAPLAPAFSTPPVSLTTIEPADIARERTWDAIAYVFAMLILAAGAGALGGIAGYVPSTGPA